jgi:O-antigen/teichoic acid export membrane protein
MQATPGSSAPAEGAPNADDAPAVSVADASSGSHGVIRNTLYLTLAQVVTIPIALAGSAMAGWFLGPEEFGYMYQAMTLCALAMLVLEWGHSGAIPAFVARDRASAATVLGTSFAWRLGMAVPLGLLVALLCWAVNYGTALRWTIALTFPVAIMNSLGSGLKDTIRGFERTDIPAKAHVAQQALMLVLVLPVLALGGHLRSLLVAYFGIAAIILVYLLRALRPLSKAPLSYDKTKLKPLLVAGTPFVFFGVAMVAQPYLDSLFLSKLAPQKVIGWYGVAQRLTGQLIFPASALIGALYPTLCRLKDENHDEFVRVTRNSLYGVSLLAFPAAIGCAIFPELGVMIYGRAKFAGAEADLRVLSGFLFLVYFSMPLGTCVLAAGKQRAWALVQCISIVISCSFVPALIPYFQRTHGNGALATCWGIVLGEALIVACGLALSPRGVFDGALGKSMLLSALAGLVMIGLAVLTKPISLFLAVPVSVLGYALTAYFSGAVEPTTVQKVKATLARKFARFAS